MTETPRNNPPLKKMHPINSTWPGTAFQANVRSAVRHATGWLSPHRGGRPVGRHAGPPRPLFGRRAPR